MLKIFEDRKLFWRSH